MTSLFTYLKTRWVVIPLVVSAIFSSTVTLAQTACNGKALFTATIVSGQLTCGNGACHGPNPAANQNKLRNGANNGSAIGAAINNVSEMRFLAGKLTTTELSDLGAYIATPAVACNTGSPAASLSTASLTFASTNVGATAATQVATVTNSGTAALVIASTTVTGADFAIASNTCTAGLSIAAGGSCAVTARFTPTASGARSGSITISHNAPPAASTVSLSGTGVAVVVGTPTATLSAASLSFASTNVGATAATQVATITNSGTAALVIASSTVTGADFAIAANTCTAGLSIAAGGSCAVTARFTPTVAGARIGSITINHNAAPAASTVSLSGTGVAVVAGTPNATLSAVSLTFASTTVGLAASTQFVTLTNSGTVGLVLAATAVSASDFAVTANTCSAGLSVAPSASCTLTISFTPTAVGARSGSVTISHNASPATSTISLSGTGAAAPPAGSAIATSSAAALTFPSTTVGVAAATQTWTLTNTGAANFSVSGMTISGSEFSGTVNTCTVGTTVVPGANCMVSVRFVPSAPGTRTATLSVSHSVSPGTTTVNLTGAGVAATIGASPTAQLNETALVLADTSLGAVAPGLSVTLTNTGSGAMLLGEIAASPGEFRVAASNCTAGASLSPGAHCTAIITFAPTAIGARFGAVTFNHNATPPTSSVTLSASGIAASTVAPVTRLMVEYLYTPLNYYFITSRDAEKTLLDSVATFQRTGASFPVYATQQGEMRGITRFYFDQVARSMQRGSHFYTLLDSDLLLLGDQNPERAKTPGMAQNEGVDSFAFLPINAGVGGSCAGGLLPVYRLFRGNARFPDDPNHRFTTSLTTYNSAIAAGWDGEGVNFCVPAQ